MKILFSVILIILSSVCFSQAKKDSVLKKTDSAVKVKPDSVLTYTDTVRFSIPSRYMQAFSALVNQDEDGLSLGQYKTLVAMLTEQSKKQLVKKPKK